MDVQEPSPSSTSSSSNEHDSSTTPSTSATTPKRKTGRKKFRETRHPVYCGVRHRNGGDKWVCEIREPCTKNRIWLGTYPTPELAARAYDVAAIALRGRSARLNFPDSSWALPRAHSTSPCDIRRAVSQISDSTDQKPEKLPSPSQQPPQLPPPALEVFVDEEELFNMPGLLNQMAEGMLLTPPGMKQEVNWDGMDWDMEFSLERITYQRGTRRGKGGLSGWLERR
ncbi:hypothetical protein J5N97_021401 [Dioscorea zingiberensis]|uniref:AP2/ERF domain-containing protein n=1 Tax=Dioscorea zingiberensis TaxID=325984 RepID=A0A9D5HEN8_9LILI|nr:hypothetical protein J5N97_021401 [Dioscorea zingiberensis]